MSRPPLRARALRPGRAGGRRAIGRRGRIRSLAVALDRMIDRLGFAVAQILRPEPPILAGLSARGRLEGGEAPQSLAARSCERMVVGDERIAGPRRAQAGEGRARASSAARLARHTSSYSTCPVAEAAANAGAKRRKRGGQRLVARQARVVERVDEDRIEETAIRRVVGARPVPVAGKQHVQRAQPQIGRADAGPPFRPRARGPRSRRSPGRDCPRRRGAAHRAGPRRRSACAQVRRARRPCGGAIVSAHSTPSTMRR